MQPYRTDRLEHWAGALEQAVTRPAAAIVAELLEQEGLLERAAQRLLAILQIDEARADTIVCLYEQGRPVLHLRLERKVTVCGREARHCGVEQGRWLSAADREVGREGEDTLCLLCAHLASEFPETKRPALLSLSVAEKRFVLAAAEQALAEPAGDPAVGLLAETQRALFEVTAARAVELGQGWLLDRWLRRPLQMRRWLEAAYPAGVPLVESADIVSALESSPALLLRLFDGLGPTWQRTPLYEDVVPSLLVRRWPEAVPALLDWAASPHGRDPLVQQLAGRVRSLAGAED